MPFSCSFQRFAQPRQCSLSGHRSRGEVATRYALGLGVAFSSPTFRFEGITAGSSKRRSQTNSRITIPTSIDSILSILVSKFMAGMVLYRNYGRKLFGGHSKRSLTARKSALVGADMTSIAAYHLLY